MSSFNLDGESRVSQMIKFLMQYIKQDGFQVY